MEYTIDKAARSLKHYILNATPSEPLSFDMTVIYMGDRSMLLQEFRFLKSWLLGKLDYHPLVIQDPKFDGIHFNCYIDNAEDIQYNGYNGIKVTVVCNSGGASHVPVTHSEFILGGKTFVHINRSDNNDYSYPTVRFIMDDSSTSFSVTNVNDGNRVMRFVDLTPNEIIEIDGETKIVTSSLGIKRLENFNKNYLRFVPGINKLICSAGATHIDITDQDFVRLGG